MIKNIVCACILLVCFCDFTLAKEINRTQALSNNNQCSANTWEKVKNSKYADDFKHYIQKCPKSKWTILAQYKLSIAQKTKKKAENTVVQKSSGGYTW